MIRLFAQASICVSFYCISDLQSSEKFIVTCISSFSLPFLTFPCLHFIHPASFIPSLFSAPSLSLLFHFSFSRLFRHIPIFYRLSYTDTQKVYTSIFLVIFLSIYTQPETESHELLSFQHYHKSSCVPGRNGS